MRSVIVAVILATVGAMSAQGAAPQAPPLPQSLCPCGDTCQCPTGTCPACPVALTAAPVRVCDANGCRLVPASSPVASGFAGAAVVGQYQSYRQSTPFMHRGPVRSFFARLLGR